MSTITFNPFRWPFPGLGQFSDTEVLISTQLNTHCVNSEDLQSSFSVHPLLSNLLTFGHLHLCGLLASWVQLRESAKFHLDPPSLSQLGNNLKSLSWGNCRTHFLFSPLSGITLHHLDKCCFMLFYMGFCFWLFQ